MKSLFSKTASLVVKVAQEAPFMAGPDYPGVRPSTVSSATQAIWQDPSSYDPYLHAPPYLPPLRDGQKMAKAAFVVASGLELTGLLTLLRAVAVVHQTHHWVSQGASYYADHLMFDRLYSDMLPEIDQIAERAVGTGGLEFVHNFRGISAGVVKVLDGLGDASSTQAVDLVQKSLEAEGMLLNAISLIVEKLKASENFTRGTDNLIASIEDKHEEHKYLLQQRLSSVDWKAASV